MQSYQEMLEKGQLIGHGAEAKCYKIYDESAKQHFVIKHRIPKKYRHPILDSRINTERVKSESKILQKVWKMGIKVPKVAKVLPEQYQIVMQYIDGTKLKDKINQCNNQQAILLIEQLADIIKNLHAQNIIHGDLTTSNMVYHHQGIYLLDFGLASISQKVEDKAVDLYLFERAFVATHPSMDELFHKFLQRYGEKSVLDRLEVVRQRGRKKVAFG